MKTVSLMVNHYDTEDFCYETVHFEVSEDWLTEWIAPDETIETFIPDYNSDDAEQIYTVALLEHQIINEYTEQHNSMKDIVDAQKEQEAVDKFYGVDNL